MAYKIIIVVDLLHAVVLKNVTLFNFEAIFFFTQKIVFVGNKCKSLIFTF